LVKHCHRLPLFLRRPQVEATFGFSLSLNSSVRDQMLCARSNHAMLAERPLK